MDKLLGFMCAVLFARNAGAAITGWTGDISGAGPEFTLSTTISESAAVGTSLFKVGATTDAAPVTLTLDSTVPASKATYANGVVTLSATVDFETNPLLKVLIKAVDSTTGTAVTATATVTIKVTDDPASSDTAYSFCLADPTAAGTAITTASTAVSGATWTVKAGEDAASFEITTAGALKAKLALTSSTKVYYKATLTLTSGSETSDWPLHVLVDNNCVSAGASPIISAMALLLSLMVSQLV